MSRSGRPEYPLRGQCIVPGEAAGDLLVLDEPISFWGGVDPQTGRIVDVHHPQRGECVRGRILALPGTRGSTAGPGALLETAFAGNGPAGILLTQPDLVCLIAMTTLQALGAPVAPVLVLDPAAARCLETGTRWRISGDLAAREQ